MDEEVAEALESFVRMLNAFGERGFAIVVEGKRDRLALERMGVQGPILTKASCGSTAKLLEALLRYKGFVPLFDLDREGSRLTKQICDLAHRRGLRAELAPRTLLLTRVRHVLTTIQALDRLMVRFTDV